MSEDEHITAPERERARKRYGSSKFKKKVRTVRKGYGKNCRQGEYEVKNKDKYKGTKTTIRYLSSYELAVFKFMDSSPHVIEWGAEMIIVPYFNPVKNRKARYIVDIYVKFKDRHGNIHTELCEVKPYAQASKAPVKTARKSQKVYESETRTWIVNQAKWQAAKKYAEDRGWSFRILTEHQIFK